MTTAVDRMLQAEYATLRIPGIHYAVIANRCRPDLPPHGEDCSGVQTYGAHAAPIATPQPCMDSRTMSAWCRSAGTYTTDGTRARKEAGWWCFLGKPGVEHHVAVSTGDGRVFAARGVHATPHIGFTPFNVDAWDGFGWPPGLPHDPLEDPLPGPVSPGEAAAMGMVGGVVPGAHKQAHPKAWNGHAPFVACRQEANGHWSMIGFNGAELLNKSFNGKPAVNGLGVSVVDLGPLNGPIFDKSEPSEGPLAGTLQFLATDGGTFEPVTRLHYPTTG